VCVERVPVEEKGRSAQIPPMVQFNLNQTGHSTLHVVVAQNKYALCRPLVPIIADHLHLRTAPTRILLNDSEIPRWLRSLHCGG
jgi:hypothetical protein